MSVSIVAAVARNGVIGADGGLPWHLPDELKLFKETTLGHVLVMGRRTYEAIGRPLEPANHLGLFRMAFMVDDAKAGCAELDRLGVAHSGPCHLDMGPDVPIEGGLLAVFFRDPDGTCLELIETPRPRRA